MDIQYFGGNCVVMNGKGTRLVVDDYLSDFGLKPVTKSGDILLYTGPHRATPSQARLVIDSPGEYEASNMAIIGVSARGHMDELGKNAATVYRVVVDDTTYLFTGNVYPKLNDEQLEMLGMVDVMLVPVGGNGYTLDATGALDLIKAIEPKVVIPLHYADDAVHYPVVQQSLEQVLKNLGMEPAETTPKYRYKPADTGSTTQLVILTRS